VRVFGIDEQILDKSRLVGRAARAEVAAGSLRSASWTSPIDAVRYRDTTSREELRIAVGLPW
jgi:hypothetical protein